MLKRATIFVSVFVMALGLVGVVSAGNLKPSEQNKVTTSTEPGKFGKAAPEGNVAGDGLPNVSPVTERTNPAVFGKKAPNPSEVEGDGLPVKTKRM